MTPVFKPFEPADAHAVISMMKNFYAIDNYPIDAAVSRDLFMEFIENKSLGRGWIILHDGKPSGYVILTLVFSFEYKGRIAFLDELFISPDARGLGLGKLALDFINEQAKLLSVKIIYLEIEGHNSVAQKLYLSKGYKIHNRGLMRLVV
ncbi:GNAT family N-acetyltransferase [Flavobacterium sp. MFBS3-15]|uniref:GNAT family N-acetyltransferase n=1 Tax=Flavobacterium sp. MFBS3-15 TaxID=2989816 RepID=UPI002236BD24|nr:GNAT family N-acetyltransferase [Flavobacterium sp. MFBS3-15]MCW4469323.1 GNAT family N-acetyltransferase [Flavobacterium sp. MFBS3-15]